VPSRGRWNRSQEAQVPEYNGLPSGIGSSWRTTSIVRTGQFPVQSFQHALEYRPDERSREARLGGPIP
jgi:hypothetical protein